MYNMAHVKFSHCSMLVFHGWQDISHKRLFAQVFSHKSFSTSFGPFAQFLVVISHEYFFLYKSPISWF